MPNRSQTGASLILAVAVARAAVLFLLLVTVLGALWLAPFLWFAFGAGFIQDPQFRFILMLNLLIWWSWSQRLTWSDIQALRKSKRPLPRQEWSVEVPSATQPWARQLLESIESRFEHLRGRLEICLSFVPGVEYERSSARLSGKWRMVIGVSTIAFVSTEELKALLLSGALSRFHPAARLHFFLSGLLRKAERAKSLLPPDSGFFSFVRCLIECTISTLQPFPVQLQKWTAGLVDEAYGAGMVGQAFTKATNVSALQAHYLQFYDHTAIKRGLMPPYVEGMARLYGESHGGSECPAFLNIPGLWVYERRLLEGCLGQDSVSQLRPISWDDLHQTTGLSSPKENGCEFRSVLDGFTVADIPELVREWRSVLRRWLHRTKRAPGVTPDRQREIFLLMLGSALGGVLIEAGWRVGSPFGQEISLVKDERKLTPIRLVKELGSGTISSEAYEQACLDNEIADLTLGAPAVELVSS